MQWWQRTARVALGVSQAQRPVASARVLCDSPLHLLPDILRIVRGPEHNLSLESVYWVQLFTDLQLLLILAVLERRLSGNAEDLLCRLS